jgi:uncharacterized membrane protein
MAGKMTERQKVAERMASIAEPQKPRWSWFVLAGAGLVMGALFFLASLTPSLMPRDPLMQGVLGGVVAGIGYQLGFGALLLWRYLMIPEPGASRNGSIVLAEVVIALAIIAFGLWASHGWQDETRRVVGLDPVAVSHRLTIGGVALVVFIVLGIVFRAFGLAVSVLFRLIRRVLPERIAIVAGSALAIWLFWALIDGFLLQRVLDAADESFATLDAFIDPDLPPPSDPLATGSSASLVRWEDMGRRGREFVTTAPTLAEIQEFVPEATKTPIRIYVGRNSAETTQERADIALQELIRVGGFDREILVVMVPVGTGWMDPGAQDTLDFIAGGDVATVAAQYSYLTSVLSLWVHPQDGIDQSRDLFDTIYRYWTTLPKDDRPKFYVHGLSQAAFTSEMTLPLLDLLGDPIGGAFWAGSPFMSPFWARIRDNPNPGGLPWRPQYGNGSLMRVMDQFGGLDEATAPWGPIRLVFLQYPSDAIVHFTFDMAFRRPNWLGPERAPDVSPELRWVPVVTMFQTALDMALALQVPRFGHFYVYQDYIDGWAALLDPPGWSPERAEELKAIFALRPDPF